MRSGHGGGCLGGEGAYGGEWCGDGVEAVGVCTVDLALGSVERGERY